MLTLSSRCSTKLDPDRNNDSEFIDLDLNIIVVEMQQTYRIRR